MNFPLPKLRELKEAITALIFGPDTVNYPEEPAQPSEDFRGAPEFQEDGCIGCGGCENVCPAEAIEAIDILDADKPYRKMVRHFDQCIFCGQCVELCTTGEGIEYTDRFDLSTHNREEETSEVEKELVFCSCCGDPISAREHIKWVAEEIEHKAYSNPTLYLAKMAALGVVSEAEIEKGLFSGNDRAQRMGYLCPACKRDVALYEAHHEVEETPDFEEN